MAVCTAWEIVVFFLEFSVIFLIHGCTEMWRLDLFELRSLSFASSQAICTDSLTSPAEDEDPLCQCLPVTGCRAAVFIPTQPARVAVIHHSQRSKVLSVLDISIKKTRYKSEIQSE